MDAEWLQIESNEPSNPGPSGSIQEFGPESVRQDDLTPFPYDFLGSYLDSFVHNNSFGAHLFSEA